MKLSIQATMIFAAVFAAFCFAFAIPGFWSLGDITDATQMADAKGFAWFWTFLGTVAILLGGLSWWITRGRGEDE